MKTNDVIPNVSDGPTGVPPSLVICKPTQNNRYRRSVAGLRKSETSLSRESSRSVGRGVLGVIDDQNGKGGLYRCQAQPELFLDGRQQRRQA